MALKYCQLTPVNATFDINFYSFLIWKVVNEEVILTFGGYADNRGGVISDAELYSSNGECNLQVK